MKAKTLLFTVLAAMVFLSVIPGTTASDTALLQNAKAYLKFDNRNGTTTNAINFIRNMPNGTYNGTLGNVTGKYGGGMSPNDGAWAQLLDNANFECGSNQKNCSFTIWAARNTSATFGYLVHKGSSYDLYYWSTGTQWGADVDSTGTTPAAGATTGTWDLWGWTYDGTTLRIYKNAVPIYNHSTSAAAGDNGNNIGIGATGTGTTLAAGAVDEYIFWSDRVLSQDDMWEIYLHNSTIDNETIPPSGQVLTVRAQNVINNTIISGLCANVTNGTNSASGCNVTGTMVIFNQSQIFGTINITIYNVTNHFNATSENYGFTLTATKDVPVWQAWIQLTASRAYIGTAISSFNSTNGLISNSTNSGTLYLRANNGTQNISVGVAGNYTETYLVTVPNVYATKTYDADNTYDAKYNFTAFALNTQSGIQTFTTFLTNSLFTNANKTTAAYKTIHTTLQGYSHTATLQAAGYAYQNTTFTTTNAWGAYNFTVYTTNSINISFYDEMNNNLLSGMLVSLEYIGTFQSGNTSTLSGHIYLDLLTPDSYILRYNAPDYNTRFYDFTLLNNTFSRLNLTLLNASEDSNQNVTVTVKDNLDNFIPNAVVKLYKYDVTTNTYDLISTRNTNFQGKTVFDILVDREFYKFIVEYEGAVVLTTSPSYIYGTSITLIIDLITGSGFTPAITNSRISGQISFINSSNTLVFTYNDASNTASQGCLYVYRLTSSGRTAYNQSCSTSPSGTVYAVVERLNNTAYIADGKVQDSGGSWHLVTSHTLFFDNPMPDSQENLFFMFIIMAVFALIGIWKIEISILLASSVPLLFSMAQLTRLSYLYTVPIFALGLVFAWVVARR